MKLHDIACDREYSFKGDRVLVLRILAGKTARSARVRYRLLKKGRATGTLNVGDEHTIGIVHFAENSRPL